MTNLLPTVHSLVKTLASINPQAVREYAPVVDGILRSQSRNTQHIERTLDGLLDFCGYPPALALYKKLCRHYWEIDPSATASYVAAYRDRWDSDEKED